MRETHAPFADLIRDPLPGRLAKPRRTGVTMVIDKGLGLRQTAELLEAIHPYVDFWKLPFGTAALYPLPVLEEKIRLVRRHDVHVYPGGTFLEVAWMQDRAEAFLDRCRALGFTAVEVSDGTVALDLLARRTLILAAKARGFAVVSEVGKKDPQKRLASGYLHRAVEEDLAAGSSFVIVEGRESGVGVGVYGPQGEIQEEELQKVVASVRDVGVLIWEAPRKAQQEAFIVRFGPNANLGNIPPEEVLALEALRRGLRADTLRHALGTAGEGAERQL